MKARIGGEISKTTVSRILDIRQPLVPHLSPKHRREEGREREEAEKVEEQQSRKTRTGESQQRGSKEVTTGRAKDNPPEYRGAGSVTAPTEETARVRRHEGGLSAANTERVLPAANPANIAWYRRIIPWRALLITSTKLGIFIGLSFISLSLKIPLPEQLIAIYASAALLFAIDSQRTFLIALIFLIAVAGWSVAGLTDRAENFAIYAFYFLLIGIVSALRELKSRPQI
jgi:hypothetical protein